MTEVLLPLFHTFACTPWLLLNFVTRYCDEKVVQGRSRPAWL